MRGQLVRSGRCAMLTKVLRAGDQAAVDGAIRRAMRVESCNVPIRFAQSKPSPNRSTKRSL